MSDRKFILNSTALGRVTLEDDPEGWDTVKKVYSRDLKRLGVFRKRTAALKFVGDGLDYCVELFELTGTESVMNVIVMQKKDYEDAWELEYEGVGKFNPFDLEWGEDLAPSVSIEFEDSGFHNKFLTRSETLVNIGNTVTAEGLDIGEMPVRTIQVHQRVVQENNNFTISTINKYYGAPSFPDPEYIKADFGHVVPCEKISGDTDFIETPTDYLIENAPMFCGFLAQNTAFTIRTNITASGNVKIGLTGLADVKFIIRQYTDESDLNIYTDTVIFTEPLSGASDEVVPFSVNFDLTNEITLAQGHAFTIACIARLSGGQEAIYDIVYTVCTVDIQLIQNFDEYITNCHYRYEFMKRLVQLATDQEDCFKSDVLGRTDLGYVSNGRFYNNVLFSGKQLRGLLDYPTWSFDRSLKSVKGIWNMGCGIEKIGGKFKVVVEELPYFFRGDISVTLHNVTKLKRTVNESFTFSEVRVGYEKAEYEQVNGLEEYNNKCVFTTFIKSDTNILDLISPERADGYGMEFARRKNWRVAASEDTPYDNEVFTAMVNEVDGVLRTQKDENYSAVENIQSPESAMNLDITPQRNLLRNGDWVYGCCNKFPLEYVRFSSADKVTDLSTVRTGESGVVEQTSIQNSALQSSLWLNLNYLFEAAIVPSEVARIELKPGSLIKFSPFSRQFTRKYFYGWILEIAVGGKERSGTFTLLAANIHSDRLKIIDPDGIDTTDPSTPLSPSNDDAGFEYAFEHVLES